MAPSVTDGRGTCSWGLLQLLRVVDSTLGRWEVHSLGVGAVGVVMRYVTGSSGGVTGSCGHVIGGSGATRGIRACCGAFLNVR